MAAVNYATKYASVVDERFTLGSLTSALVNNNFDWLGVKTVKVFSRSLATLNDYQTSGSNRYGTPDELGNTEQEMTVTQDKAFTYTIDAASEQDTNGTMEAAATLAENIDNLVIPAMDTYRIGVIASKAPTAGTVSGKSHVIVKSITASNAYEEFLACQEVLDDDKAPQGGRIAVVTPAYLNKIKLDDHFTKRGDMGTTIAINGLVGEIDGVPVIKAPTTYFPANVDFVITNPLVCPSPIKLQEFKINYDAPGISGALVEARVRYDAFVLDKKADAIAVHRSQEATTTVSLNKTTLTIPVGDSETLKATVSPVGTSVTWTSSDDTKAIVNNGVVTGVAAGTATITVAAGTETATCTVTVSTGA